MLIGDVESRRLRIKDLLRKLQFLKKGEQLLWEPIDQRNGNRGALSGLGPTRHPPPPIRSIGSAFTKGRVRKIKMEI